jgi:hypothetical protein
MSNTDQATEADRAKALIALCRKGRLYDIEKWIAAGKSLDISAATKRGRQRSLLEIAVEIGFHSLVELIAKHEAHQSAKDAALSDAVSSRRLDLVELLLANGADIKSVPLADVLLTWEPKLIQFFLDHGQIPWREDLSPRLSAQKSEPPFAPLLNTSGPILNSQRNYRSNSIAPYAISALREI